jgi:hypothetical protein
LSNSLDWLLKSARTMGIQGDDEKLTAVISAAMMAGADESKATVSLKSVNEVLREYTDVLERYVVDTVNGNMTSGEMSRAHKALLKRLAPEAYREGMREGGVRDPEAEMEDDDDSAIDDWIAEQAQYTLEFARACAEAGDATGDDKRNKRDAVLDRAGEWVDSLRVLGQRGYLSAKGNIPLTFDGDDGEESCVTCDKYKGQRHRKSWWEKRGLLGKPNSLYVCGRFKCQHGFYDDDGTLVIE